MARSLRIEGAGLWYHVMSRGNAGNAVFLEANDYRAFLARMASLSEQLQIELHAGESGVRRYLLTNTAIITIKKHGATITHRRCWSLRAV